MPLDYALTTTGLEEEIKELACLRERLTNELTRIDERIDAVSAAARAFARAFEAREAPDPMVPALTLPENAPVEKVANPLAPEFEITANIREILQEGEEFSAADVRSALVERGWDDGRYGNPLAVVHQVLNRLIRNGDVGCGQDDWGKKTFYDKRMAQERWAREEQESAEKRAHEKKLFKARASIRSKLIQPCREILRSYPRGISSKKVYRELQKMGAEKIGIDFSCYSQPTNAIALVMTEDPGVRRFKVDSDGVIRTHYQLVDNGGGPAE